MVVLLAAFWITVNILIHTALLAYNCLWYVWYDIYILRLSLSDDARVKFKKYVNILAQTKNDGNQKLLTLKPKYRDTGPPLQAPTSPVHSDPRNALGIPVSPLRPNNDFSLSPSTHRQPPPYRPPPPPVSSPNHSFDNVSIASSNFSFSDFSTPQVPPRRKSTEKGRLADEQSPREEKIPKVAENGEESQEKQTISVKERTQKFNRMASIEDELSSSPRQQKDKKKTDKVSLI